MIDPSSTTPIESMRYRHTMQIVLPDLPPVLEAWLDERRERGQDLYDYVIDGTYYVTPAPAGRHAAIQAHTMWLLGTLTPPGLTTLGPFNLGDHDKNYVVPDFGLVAEPLDDQVFLATAALVGEVLSPDDRAPEKFPFYYQHDVDEILMVDPEHRTVTLWRATAGGYVERDTSTVVPGLAVERIHAVLWG